MQDRGEWGMIGASAMARRRTTDVRTLSHEIVYTEDGMQEGMQIEDANIPIDAKVALPPIATVSR